MMLASPFENPGLRLIDYKCTTAASISEFFEEKGVSDSPSSVQLLDNADSKAHTCPSKMTDLLIPSTSRSANDNRFAKDEGTRSQISDHDLRRRP